MLRSNGAVVGVGQECLLLSGYRNESAKVTAWLESPKPVSE